MTKLQTLKKPKLEILVDQKPKPISRIAVWDLMGPMGNYKRSDGTINWEIDGQPWQNLHALFMKDPNLREILNEKFGYDFRGDESIPLDNLDFNDELLAESLAMSYGILTGQQGYFANPGMFQSAKYFRDKDIVNTIVTANHPVGMKIAYDQILRDVQKNSNYVEFPYGVSVCGLSKKNPQTWYDAKKAIEDENEKTVEVITTFEDSIKNLHAALIGLSKDQEAVVGFHVLSPHKDDYKKENVSIKDREYQIVHANMEIISRYIQDNIE